MARQPRNTSTVRIAINPIAAAYFRAADDEGETTPGAPERAPDRDAPGASSRADDQIPTADISKSTEAVIELLAEAARLRHRGNVELTYSPTDRLSVSGFGGTLQDDYNRRGGTNSAMNCPKT